MDLNLNTNFINNLPKINATYATLYLYAYALFIESGKTFTMAELATEFNILQTDVNNAFTYFENMGLLHISDGTIEFTKKKTLEPTPTYSPKELEAYEQYSEEFRELKALAENGLGRAVKHTDLATVYALYDHYELSFDVIKHLISYCVSLEKRNVNYWEEVAINWIDNGVTTAEEAQEKLINSRADIKAIMKAVGTNFRDVANVELKLINRWIDDYKMPLEVILEACDLAIMNGARSPFAYVEKTLSSWAEAGISSLADIKANTTTSKSDKQSSTTKKTKKNKFDNYESRKTDLEELESLFLGGGK